jgi:hypothetical protein
MNNEAPDTGVVVCSECMNDTPEHYMIWDGEKNTVCLWCDEEDDNLYPSTQGN